jgi:hypothetical protein
VRPVSGIDQVALDQSGTVIGRAAWPCIPEPPPPVSAAGPVSARPAAAAWGDVTWMVTTAATSFS